MKILKSIIATLCAVMCLSSCDEWLSATSNKVIPSDKLFSTRSGFHSALSGVYINMGSESAYGKYYTWYANEMAAYPLVSFSQVDLNSWQKHNYTQKTVKSEIAAMWVKGYNIIAGINNILEELENRRDVITSDIEYSLLKGELLGLRAYVHFDMMRMFGVADWSGANASKLTIPYVTVYDKEPVQQRSYKETSELLMNDINVALELLEETDPVTGVKNEDFDATLNDDGFWSRRTAHLNYYAVKALAARVYQWNNDTATAAEYAQDVIDGAFANDAVSWVDADRLLLATSGSDKDWTFSSEHLFSLLVTGLSTQTLQFMMTNQDTAQYIYVDLIANTLFPILQNGLTSGAEDIRGSALHLKYNAAGYSCSKLYGLGVVSSEIYRNRMPMIRISEMFYMIAENHIKEGRDADALAAMDAVRTNRGIKDPLPEDTDPESELMKEYYREFISEGQVFYWLKHRNVTSSLSPEFSVRASDLIYPYPDAEIDYGRIQEL